MSLKVAIIYSDMMHMICGGYYDKVANELLFSGKDYSSIEEYIIRDEKDFHKRLTGKVFDEIIFPEFFVGSPALRDLILTRRK